ncbi:hypothetical protein FQN50_003376 [Emmonsiellopsis sp. PD_5]|nr:hypothetical protein FQN50_003376 [Emmonsiellopsis sp. PD_5]
MRAAPLLHFVSSTLLLALLVPSTSARRDTSNDKSPFYQPLFDNSNLDPVLDRRNVKEALEKRQNSCPDGYNSCALLGAGEACCEPKAVCSRDDANSIACCPSGAACTGTLNGPSPTQPPESSGFMFPQPGTGTATGPTTTGPTITGAPFPFTYIATTFPNQQECVSAYSGCASQYSSCTASLGGVNGVTVGGGNGYGTTVPGSAPSGNPQSICASLSTRACYGLQEAYCTAFGGTGNGAASFSRRSGGGLYDVFAGVVVAVAGMIT